MKAQKIKFVYFDIGGVFLNWRKSLKKFAKMHKRTEEEVERVFAKYDNDFCRGQYSEVEMWHKYREELNLHHIANFSYVEFFTDHFVSITETHELAIELASQFHLGLLTNLHPGSFEPLFKKGHVPRLNFKAMVKSYEVGFIKPEKEIYHIAEKASGVKPEEIFFIDDMEKNIEVAQSLGWKGAHFNENNPKKSVAQIRKRLQEK